MERSERGFRHDEKWKQCLEIEGFFDFNVSGRSLVTLRLVVLIYNECLKLSEELTLAISRRNLSTLLCEPHSEKEEFLEK